MAKVYVFALIALIALQGAFAKPKGKKTEDSPFEELSRNTEAVINNVTQTLGIKDIPDSKKVVEILNTNAQNLANNVEEVVNKLKDEVKAHQGDFDNVIKEVREKLTETATKLQQAAGPEATNKAKELKKNLDDGLKNAYEQIQKLVKAVEPDATKAKSEIQEAAQTFLTKLNEVGTNLQNEIKSNVEAHEKTHGKH